MVASFASAAARRGQRWTYLVQIEGVGDTTGLYTWTINVPDYASATARYTGRDTIAELPDPGDERAPILGGMPEAGVCTVKLVDVGDRITSAMRVDRPPAASVATALTASGTTLTVNSGDNMEAGSAVVWIGTEAILCTSRTGTSVTITTRGYLGTDAQSHAVGAMVYLSPPFLRTRRMHVYLAPTDADSEAIGQEYEVGSYRIDRISVDPRNLGVWSLGGPTEIKDLSRLIASRTPDQMRVFGIDGDHLIMEPIAASRGSLNPRPLLFLWPDYRAFLRVGGGVDGEVILVRSPEVIYDPIIELRAQLNTEQEEITRGEMLLAVVTADPDFGWVRFSPGPTPSNSRGSGTWTIESHAVDWMLAVLTSSCTPDDGLELVNDVDTYGNWSSLPVGYGIGYRASRIDFASFLSVKQRFPDALFPALVLGDKKQTFAEWATENFLKPMGWFLAVIGGQLTLVAPRLLLQGETAEDTIGVNEIIEFTTVEMATDLIAGVITYRFRGDRGMRADMTFRASDMLSMLGSRSQYTVEDDAIEIEVPGVRAGSDGLAAFLLKIAQRRLIRAIRAPWRIRMVLDASKHAFYRGMIVELTHPDLPDLNTGTRGWTSVPVQVSDVGPLRIEGGRGVVRDVTVIAYPNVLAGRVPPSAIITSISGAGSPWTITVAANRYTSPDADLYETLPDVDAEAFAVTDVCKTITRAGLDVTTGYVITAISGNTITVTGTAIPVAGDVFVFDDHPDATTTQQTRFVAWAEDDGEIVPGVAGWPYGEG